MRAPEGQEPQRLASLPASAQDFNDDQVKPGAEYYYSIVNLYGKAQSTPTDPGDPGALNGTAPVWNTRFIINPGFSKVVKP